MSGIEGIPPVFTTKREKQLNKLNAKKMKKNLHENMCKIKRKETEW